MLAIASRIAAIRSSSTCAANSSMVWRSTRRVSGVSATRSKRSVNSMSAASPRSRISRMIVSARARISLLRPMPRTRIFLSFALSSMREPASFTISIILFRTLSLPPQDISQFGDQRAHFGAFQVKARAVDDQPRGGFGDHVNYFEAILPQRLPGFDQINDAVGQAQQRRQLDRTGQGDHLDRHAFGVKVIGGDARVFRPHSHRGQQVVIFAKDFAL